MPDAPSPFFKGIVDVMVATRQKQLWPNSKVGDRVEVTVAQLRFDEPVTLFEIHERATTLGLDGFPATQLEAEARRHGTGRQWLPNAKFVFTRIK